MPRPSLPPQPGSSPDDAPWGRRWKTSLVFATALLLLYPMDRLLLGTWSLETLTLRAAWGAQLLLYVGLWQRMGPRWEQRLSDANSVITAMWFLVFIHFMDQGRGPYLHLLPCLPLIVALVQPFTARPAVLSGTTCSLGMLLMTWERGTPLEAVGWACLVAAATFFGVYGSVRYRGGQEALIEARLERTRREALERLAVAERQRAQTEKMATVGRLAANVMHEVNNPLAFVRSNLEFLRTEVLEEPPREEARAQLAEVFDETRQGLERIQQIVSDLKGFSRLDEEAPSECALRDVVMDAARLAGVRLKHVARLHVDIPPELPAVFAIPRRLAQVLLNLLVNAGDALEAAQVQGGEVRVTGRVQGRTVALLVEDNGPGFPAEVLPRLFEAFFTTKGPEQGTGLGLNLSRELVERFGGTLRAENRPEGGARLCLELPVHLPPPHP